MKYVSPSVKETAFNCPHCGALAKQFWYSLAATQKGEDAPTPHIYYETDYDEAKFSQLAREDGEFAEKLKKFVQRMATGSPFLEKSNGTLYTYQDVNNMHVSRCYNCKDIAVWIFDKLVYPKQGEAPSPNSDLPLDILRDYNEASVILDYSPRGAAALIRLAIQKLCKELGQSGKDINKDIGGLVQNGLDPRVQKALDAVRVIGNNAVHPGQIDLKDDKATAESLFRLLNLIADKMISEPKHVDEVYSTLPEGALKAIKERDKK